MSTLISLTPNALLRNGVMLRQREAGESFRDFLIRLLTEFYQGEDYRFNVIDDLGLACLSATAACLHYEAYWASIPPERRALVFATRHGSLLTDIDYQRSINDGGRTSPRTFVQTLANMAAGQVAACFALRGEHFVLVQSGPDQAGLEEVVGTCLEFGGAEACLYGWMEHSPTATKVALGIRYAAEKDHSLASAEMTLSSRS